ncbi:MAG: hypothetical protein ACI85O_000966 [Saprospiraceae bacterium]|jgi:hypothetical protein
MINEELQGQTEYSVTSGRVDILTETHAIEVERAHKWKQSIGQALWYGLQTSKEPGIILIIEQGSDYKYFIQLNTALEYAGLVDKIKVWQYPQDFPEANVYKAKILDVQSNPENEEKTYWKSSFSNVRHNSTCRYYQTTRGESCTRENGIACKKCGG